MRFPPPTLLIAGFEHLGEARQFLRDLRDRFARFCLELHPGQDAPDRVRPVRGRAPGGAGRREARDVRFPRLHAHLREDGNGTFPGQADHDLEADAGKAERGQRPAQAAPARARPGARAVAGQRGTRPHGLLRGARQHPGRPGLPDTGDPALARGSAKPQPARLPKLEPDEPPRGAVAPATPASCTPTPTSASTFAPEAGAQCVSSARWDLRGGPPARTVPTAIAGSNPATPARRAYRLSQVTGPRLEGATGGGAGLRLTGSTSKARRHLQALAPTTSDR